MSQPVSSPRRGDDAAARGRPVNPSTPWEAGRFDQRGGPRKVLFGQMYEDAAIERTAFAPGARVFCIASAGDMAMALSAAHEVTAIDINPVQLDYARARLGGAPAITGSAERLVGLGRGAMALFGWRRAALEQFLALDDLTAQREFWRLHLDTRGFRLATDLLLSVSGLKAVYASPFLAMLPAHFGRVMRERLAHCFATFPNRGNSYARALLLGETPQAPDFQARRIALVGGDAAAYLEQCAPASFDAFTLSNILDGAPAGYRQRLFAAVRRAAAPGATVVLRSFAEPTHRTPYDAAARDRSILWGVVDVRPADVLEGAVGVPIPVPG